MNKLLTSSKGADDLSIGFDRDRGRRTREFIYKTIGGKFHVRVYFKDFFGFAEHQENGTYGVEHKMFLKRNIDPDVQNREGGADAKLDKTLLVCTTLYIKCTR